MWRIHLTVKLAVDAVALLDAFAVECARTCSAFDWRDARPEFGLTRIQHDLATVSAPSRPALSTAISREL
jgi:hypothetical protein